MINKIFSEIDKLFPKYVRFWEDICNIESPTADKAGVDAVGKYVSDAAAARGWKVETFPQPVSGDVVCITMNEGAKGTPIALSAHMDTVHPKGLFGTPPVRIEGGTIYGPGVSDCKGGIAEAFLVMDALERQGYRERPILLLLQSDEEVGSKYSGKATIGYMCEKAVGCAAFLNLETQSGNSICVARKGIISFTFKIHGIEAHASRCATMGASAILEAAHKIIEMEKLKDDDGLTCSCGVISGGTVPNTVPGYCEFKANIRFATAEQLEWVREYAKKVAETVYVEGCRCELEQFGFRVAMEEKPINLELANNINAAFEKAGLSVFSTCRSKGGSDAADVTVYGKTPCVDNLGVRGDFIHSPKEQAPIDSLLEMAKRLAAIICHLE
jgi:glutamate carboxypeptidase